MTIRTVILSLCLALSAMAQTATPALATDFVAAGAAVNEGSTPNAWAAYAHLASESTGTYVFSKYSVTSVKFKPFSAQTTVRTGVAQFVRKLGPVSVYGVLGAGASMAGSSIGGAFSGGGFAVYPIGKTQWAVIGSAEVLQTAIGGQTREYDLGIGRTLGKGN